MTTHAPPVPPATGKALEAWLRQGTRRVRAPLAASVAAGLLGGVCLIAQAWLLARVVDAVVIGGRGLDAVWPWLWALLAVFVLRAAAATLSEAIAFEAGARLVMQVRTLLHSHVVGLGPTWARRQSTGEVSSTVFDAAENIGRYYSSYLPQKTLGALLPLAVLAFVIPADWVSGLIMVVSAPLIPVFMVLIGKGTEALNQSQWRKLARMSGHFFDAIEGLTTLKLFNASKAEIAAVADTSDGYRRSTMEVLRVAFLSSLALEFFATVSIAMVAVYIGLRLYYREMEFLPGFAVLLLAPEFYRVLRATGTQYHVRMEAIGAAEAIVALLDTPPPPTATGDAILHPGPVQTVRLDGVGFAYGGAPLLHAVSFSLERGRFVALVGASGSGKTTISQLLLGFLPPDAGRVAVDGADLRTLSQDSWFERVAWLPQRPTLFHGTVMDNICLGRPGADRAAVRRAAEQAAATGLIAGLAQGYDTVIGDRGQGLSGGEAQRIGLARVFLKGADLVILDEPTAGLDPAAAATVTRSIEALSANCAVLVITHRLEAVRRADEILVLHGGRIVERGCHRDLLGHGERYAALLRAASDSHA